MSSMKVGKRMGRWAAHWIVAACTGLGVAQPSALLGANWYVDSAATGSNTGTSWANAWRSFSAISWGSIRGGDTLYISGGSSGKSYPSTLSIARSGATSESSRIYIRCGQDSGHTGRVTITGNPAID